MDQSHLTFCTSGVCHSKAPNFYRRFSLHPKGPALSKARRRSKSASAPPPSVPLGFCAGGEWVFSHSGTGGQQRVFRSNGFGWILVVLLLLFKGYRLDRRLSEGQKRLPFLLFLTQIAWRCGEYYWTSIESRKVGGSQLGRGFMLFGGHRLEIHG